MLFNSPACWKFEVLALCLVSLGGCANSDDIDTRIVRDQTVHTAETLASIPHVTSVDDEWLHIQIGNEYNLRSDESAHSPLAPSQNLDLRVEADPASADFLNIKLKDYRSTQEFKFLPESSEHFPVRLVYQSVLVQMHIWKVASEKTESPEQFRMLIRTMPLFQIKRINARTVANDLLLVLRKEDKKFTFISYGYGTAREAKKFSTFSVDEVNADFQKSLQNEIPKK